MLGSVLCGRISMCDFLQIDNIIEVSHVAMWSWHNAEGSDWNDSDIFSHSSFVSFHNNNGRIHETGEVLGQKGIVACLVNFLKLGVSPNADGKDASPSLRNSGIESSRSLYLLIGSS